MNIKLVFGILLCWSLLGQTRIWEQVQIPTETVQNPPIEEVIPPVVAQEPPKLTKKKWYKLGRSENLTAAPTPIGVRVMMSDGTEVTLPLGIWLEFKNNQLKGVFPTQYVNQPATMQIDNTWTYTRPGRNVQVWRNGILQRQGPDYILDQAAAKITPVKYPGPNGLLVDWKKEDYVTVAYLY